MSGMRSSRLIGAALVLLAACSGSGDDATSDVPESIATTTTTLPAGPEVSDTAGSEDDTAVEDAGTFVETVPDTAADEQPFIPDESPFIPPPEGSLVTTTTEPLAVQELLLRPEGLGSAVFGADPQGVIDYVTSILGGNTADTGWVDPFTFADCRGDQVRRVDWGALSLLFGDVSDVANGRLHFIGWEYGRVGEITDEPIGLRTPGGVTRGTRIVDLLVEFPDARINEGEEDLAIPPNFYVSDPFYGLLTGTSDEDYVTVMFGGSGCGE